MGQYDRSIAQATRMIKKYGQLVTWIQQGIQVSPAEPWKDMGIDPETFPVFIVFLTPKGRLSNELFHLMQGTTVPEGAPTGLMAKVPFTPALNDKVLRGTETLNVKSMDIVAPNGEPILYKLEFAS